MPQKIFTSKFGELEFERTWANQAMHIGRLTGGGYAHLTGLPVDTQAELEACIPGGEDLADALTWFAHRHDPVEEVKRQRLVLTRDGGYVFEDGSPVKTLSDLVNHLRPGPALDAAVQWFSERYKAAKEAKATAEQSQDSAIGKATARIFGKRPVVPDAKGEIEITE